MFTLVYNYVGTMYYQKKQLGIHHITKLTTGENGGFNVYRSAKILTSCAI